MALDMPPPVAGSSHCRETCDRSRPETQEEERGKAVISPARSLHIKYQDFGKTGLHAGHHDC